jgi:protein-disulfide isomerase/uncharacterized membrane protein
MKYRAGYSIYTLALIGLLISGYLFFRHLILMDVSVSGSADFCSELFNQSCDEALQSNFASFLNVPLAGWGVIYYLTIIIILLLGDFLKDKFKVTATDLAVLFTGITAALSSLFIIAFIFRVIPFCPLCLFIHVINLAIIFFVIKSSSKSITQTLHSIYSGMKDFIVTEGPIPGKTKEQIIPILLIITSGLLFYVWISMQLIKLEEKEDYSFDEFSFFDEYQSEETVDLQLSPDDPAAGNPEALVNMVIFSDFECSGCRSVSGEIKSLLSKFKTELKIIFKHYPLSSLCNSSVRTNFHENACQAAYAAEAAHRQGKFWEYHDLLFSTTIYGEEGEFIGFAEELELDIPKFTEDMNKVAAEKVAQDISLGNEIGIKGTPTVYINGKKINKPSLTSLTWLIETVHNIRKMSNPR